jgi:hypothetical protein
MGFASSLPVVLSRKNWQGCDHQENSLANAISFLTATKSTSHSHRVMTSTGLGC